MMKMDTSFLGGILLIILGLSLIIKLVFHIEFPIWRILVAFFFIFLSIKILIGSSYNSIKQDINSNNTIIFGEKIFTQVENMTEYNVIFGKAIFDLRNFKPNTELLSIKINTVLGSSVVLLNLENSIKIEANAVFAHAGLPNKNSASFGYTSFFSDSSRNTDNSLLLIKSDVIFGSFIAK